MVAAMVARRFRGQRARPPARRRHAGPRPRGGRRPGDAARGRAPPPPAPLVRLDRPRGRAQPPPRCGPRWRSGERIAAEEIAAGADLLVLGDLGIGNTTPAAALVAATFGVGADEVTGRGTGVDDAALARKTQVVAAALRRTADRVADPRRPAGRPRFRRPRGRGRLPRRGRPRRRAGAARRHRHASPSSGVAEDLEPGVVAWCAAGHRSTEPAQQLALDKLGLVPLLDVGLRLGRGHRGADRAAGPALGRAAAARDGAAGRPRPRGLSAWRWSRCAWPAGSSACCRSAPCPTRARGRSAARWCWPRSPSCRWPSWPGSSRGRRRPPGCPASSAGCSSSAPWPSAPGPCTSTGWPTPWTGSARAGTGPGRWT